MIVVNTENIPGKNYEAITMVCGACIMSKNIGRDIGSSFRNIVGGKMEAYTEMLIEAKDSAVNMLISEALKVGADAVVNVRFSSSDIVQGGAEVLVCGTAVKFI